MFDRLTKLVPPPHKPVDAPTFAAWLAIEREMGIQFPLGYFEFCQIYGAGGFRGSMATDISFYNPTGKEFKTEIEFECQRYRDENDGSRNEAIPYLIYPEPQGVLPMAVDRIDTHVYWKNTGIHQNWLFVVQWAWGRRNTKEFTCSFPEFVEKMFFRELDTTCWQEPWFLDEVRFSPDS